jgi:prepilin-type processing-associated H-X9-DG protein
VIGVIAVLVALFLPIHRGGATGAARRIQCGNHLHQIALGLRNYADVYQCLPPAYTVDSNGKPLHSWRTLILPFVEQQPLYDQIDFSKPWDDPANAKALATCPRVYQCPANKLPDGRTTYLAVAVPGGCFLSNQPRKLADITDGHDRTLMVVEVPMAAAVPWMAPQDLSSVKVLQSAAAVKPHGNGAQGALVDGSVKFMLTASMPPEKLRALITIAGDDDTEAAGD